MDRAPGHIDSLATELKTEIAKLLSPRDRQALTLVSKTWAWITLPSLWETLESDLRLRGDRQLDALLIPSSNIIKHVQNLVLTSPTKGLDSLDCLPMLINTLSPHQLQSFRSHVSVPQSSLISLLCLHDLMQLTMDENEWDTIAQFSWIRSRVSNVKRMEVKVHSHEAPGFNLELLARYCTGLETLTFGSLGSARNHHLAFLSSNNEYLEYLEGSKAPIDHTPALRITALVFQDVTLLRVASISEWIEVTRIKQLTLNGVMDSKKLFDVLATEFIHSGTQLRVLRLINLPYGGINFDTSLTSFLLSFQGLEELRIEYATDQAWTGNAGILHHGASLRSLLLVRTYQERYRGGINKALSTSDLKAIAETCPLLEHLCLNICALDGADTVSGRPANHQSTASEFEDALSFIAQMGNLRVLRLTNPSTYERECKRYGLMYRQWFFRRLEEGKLCHAFQLRAERYLRHLVTRGSNIRQLAFSPTAKLPHADSDTDKQTLAKYPWPNYVYSPTHRKGSRGKDIISAELVKDWERKLSDVVIFDDLGTYT